MKVRNDFVTNSSSSSFVIAYREPKDIDPEVLKRYPWMKFYKRMIEAIVKAEDYCGDTSEGRWFENKEAYDEWVIDNYGWRGATLEEILEDSDYFRGTYEEAMKYFNDGYSIIVKDVGYSDTGLQEVIKELGKENEDFIILSDE